MKKVYVVIELPKDNVPNILGVYDSSKKANDAANKSTNWCNVIERDVM